MKNKHLIGLAAMLAAQESMTKVHRVIERIEETEEQRKLRLASAEIKRNQSNGLKQFFYGDKSIWAINQKNADRKAKKMGLIN